MADPREEMMEGDTRPDTSDEEMLETVRQGMGKRSGDENKMSQDEANYRQGTDTERCELCANYEGGDQCAVVEGPISPDGLSDEFVSREEDQGTEAPGDAGGGMY